MAREAVLFRDCVDFIPLSAKVHNPLVDVIIVPNHLRVFGFSGWQLGSLRRWAQRIGFREQALRL